ncbi:MAG TPA: insulinase family protein [Fimbriimonadaceae bacterium]|jgi:predicted Zn-dependent peptidase
MIIALAALAAISPQVLELPDPNAEYITFQAIVKIGNLGGKDQICAQMVQDLLTDASENFNEDQIRQFSTLAGESMRCTLSGDHFRVQLEVPKGRMDLGGEILGDLLENPRFQQDALDAEIQTASTRPHSYWAEALSPFSLNYKKITRNEVLNFYHRTFIPSATTVAIGGNFSAWEGQQAIDKYFVDWQNPKPPPRYLHKVEDPPAPLLGRHTFPITTVELYGPEFTVSDAEFPAQILVATALGSGKWSSMHRILREKLGLSYVQQAVISPTPGGFQMHLIMLTSPFSDEVGLIESMRSALLEDVKTWDESTRQRALGMAQGYLLNGAPMSPLFLDGSSTVGYSLEDQTFLQGYWHEKAKQGWDSKKLLDLMSKTSLDDMRKMAQNMLTGAQGGVISGQ